MSSIGSEKERWISTKLKLGEDKRSLLDDMIIATAMITYLGPFDGTYQARIIRDKWMLVIKQYSVDFTSNFNLKDVVGDEEMVTDWIIKGLPNE